MIRKKIHLSNGTYPARCLSRYHLLGPHPDQGGFLSRTKITKHDRIGKFGTVIERRRYVKKRKSKKGGERGGSVPVFP